ncbi:hypothetical protein IQ06DRAFT_299697 [Phaeosphaeriaceae sp. SRC1lsM3a]|nr:hypothetical protein IQ06DRAFT_299697 [Stagonospora sp. SRC1lsM3a]
MDEKGFMIGVEAKLKRVFSKAVWVKDRARAPIQDEQVIKDNSKELLKKLKGIIYRASTYTKLLELENVGLIASLNTKNKRIEHGRRLLLRGKKKQPTDAIFYSPKKLKAA